MSSVDMLMLHSTILNAIWIVYYLVFSIEHEMPATWHERFGAAEALSGSSTQVPIRTVTPSTSDDILTAPLRERIVRARLVRVRVSARARARARLRLRGRARVRARARARARARGYYA